MARRKREVGLPPVGVEAVHRPRQQRAARRPHPLLLHQLPVGGQPPQARVVLERAVAAAELLEPVGGVGVAVPVVAYEWHSAEQMRKEASYLRARKVRLERVTVEEDEDVVRCRRREARLRRVKGERRIGAKGEGPRHRACRRKSSAEREKERVRRARASSPFFFPNTPFFYARHTS